MPDAIQRRFTLADAMFLVAAVGLSLFLLRIAATLGLLRYDSGHVSYAQIFEYLCVAGGIILYSLMFAVFVLTLREARTARLATFVGPGIMACVAVLVSSVFPFVFLIADLLRQAKYSVPRYDYPIEDMCITLIRRGGDAIVLAWLTMAILRRWKSGPVWFDKLGCILGVIFILVYIYVQMYYIYHMYVLLHLPFGRPR